MKNLVIKGAKEHNLKDLDLEIPLNSIICVSGPSGAGKSTLVFDTIYAESQRRYIETFSPYARQFLERLPRPKIREIKNLPAAIAISQANPVKNSRSTVATLSEITYPVRMLFFKNAIPFCPKCKISLRKDSAEDCFKRMLDAQKSGVKRAIIAINTSSDRLPAFREQGFQRAIYKGKTIDLSFIDGFWHELSQEKELFLVIERFSLKEIRLERVREAVETGFNLGNGKISLLIDGKNIEFFSNWTCPKCKYQPKRTSPLLFSFNSPKGACPTCSGFGRVIEIDWDLVIPNKALSLEDGAIRPLENWPEEKEILFDFCIEEGIPLDRPWKGLTEEQRDAIIFGRGDWYGIKEIFDWLETKRYKAHIRILLSRYRAYKRCPSCDGTRFNEMARSFRLYGIHIGEFYRFNIHEAISWCEGLEREIKLNKASENLLFDLKTRLKTIKGAGLTYLTLERASRTLSGGELSRLCLSKGVSTRLSETLYCLDEPSSGLHPRDIEGLSGVISGLKEAKNTVLMVENDPFLKRGADMIIGLGPGSGKEGGYLVKDEEDKKDDHLPNTFLRKTKGDFKDFLVIKGARENNLKSVDCRFPVGAITCVCGVSGSGKSTLIETCLYGGLLRKKGLPAQQVGKFDEIVGENYFEKIVFINQEPITKTPRACPGTYLKILDPIRKILSKEEAARALSLTPGFFSLNVDGGRCPECKGQGYELVEMQFLPDMMLTCPACKGKRFGEKALLIEHKGKNIHDFLNMTLREVGEFFKDEKSIQRAISPALGLGLSHLLLGQPLNTLSGGEAQRLKISKGLLMGKGGERTLFIIDEPTKGLHPREIRGLLKELERLRGLGNTIVVVEHDLSVIARSDWVIELGPEGGERGGRVLYEGPPYNLLRIDTPTSRFFKRKKEEPVKGPVSPNRSIQKEIKRDVIKIRGARHHNLKSINIDIPKGRFVVITGVSGSGKSSLAFDLIFKEAQRRYLESLPSYMKQFVRLFERFDVDEIEGLSPSVAIEQKNSRGSPMSTVATLSEVAHYMRLCFSNLSSPFCPKCKKEMKRVPKEKIIETARMLLSKGDARIIVPRIKNRKGWHQEEIKRGFGIGAEEVRVDGRFFKKGESVPLSRYREHTIDWVFGPFKRDHKGLSGEDISRFLTLGSGEFFIEKDGEEIPLSTRYFCKTCLISLPSPDPLLFSFHTKSGRCPQCLGLGTQDDGSPCDLCNGSRLSKEALFWKIDGKNISDIFSMEINEALTFFKRLLKGDFSEKRELSRLLFEEIIFRLKTMNELGLGYLSLDRSGESLSGGEAQRIRLSSQMASSLTGLTIVLDEPTIGLHPADNRRLINSLKRLSTLGNSVIVVEHDEDTIREGDFIVDLGPGGGKEGGEVIFSGDFKGLLRCKESKTARAFLAPIKREKGVTFGKEIKWLEVKSISENNLKDIDIKIPLNSLTFITGVSGSGKTTLLERVLARIKGKEDIKVGRILGADEIKTIYEIDHSPIGRTPRSCPATFVGLFSEIRHLFSRTPLARMNGLNASHFSFNTKEGMCPGCKGQGVIRQKLGLLPDVLTTCEVCLGKRFNEKSLGCTWKGLNISDVLSLTVNEALEHFRAIPGIRKRLEALRDLGLGYLTLGQQSPTLSGGEAQRIKIAKELSKGEGAKKLYLLDEPSVGLHFEDVKRLSDCLKRLVDLGNTVVVVEHNLALISRAQWIIDLGPGGGRFGGKLLYQGPLEGLLEKGTKTGRALKEYLEQKSLKFGNIPKSRTCKEKV